MFRTNNKGLVAALCVQAAISGAAGSSALATLAPAHVVAGVTLLNAMLAGATAMYVAVTGAGMPPRP